MNEQKPVKPVYSSSTLQVHSIFFTIQGEGPYAGRPAIFIRLAGCNIQCPQCDTQYTECADYKPADIVEMVKLNGSVTAPYTTLVVITGGEPLRQNISSLIRMLSENGYTVQIETNGTIAPDCIPYGLCTVVCSPKLRVHKDLEPHIDAYKYVLHADYIDPVDGLPTSVLGHAMPPSRPPETFGGTVYVQPIDVGNPVDNARHLKATIDVCMKFGYTLCLQIHKIINME